MASITNAEVGPESQELYGVPLTLDGSAVLHQMFRFRWPEWRKLKPGEQKEILAEAAAGLEKMEQHVSGQSALFSMIGHKADLMLVHFRNSLDHLKHAELDLARLRLNDFLEQTTSYVSVVELGLYESSVKLYRTLREKGI
ncbi:MAG TPA: chlorite dismutase family protein, partial [Candidatus Angelobacter sp.]